MPASPDTPVYVVPESQLIPVGDYLGALTPIPASRMFLINKSLSVYRQSHPGGQTFDASQGDGGASLPAVVSDPADLAAWGVTRHGVDDPFPGARMPTAVEVACSTWRRSATRP